MANTKLTPSKSDKEQSESYKKNQRWKSNREKKIERHLMKHPNDKQSENAANNVSYRRKTPYKKEWNSESIEMAHLHRKANIRSN